MIERRRVRGSESERKRERGGGDIGRTRNRVIVANGNCHRAAREGERVSKRQIGMGNGES